MTYQEALAYLDELNTFGSQLGLSRITSLLNLLGQPQNRYKTVHVTGTNGKGSTTSMLTGILSQSKIKTGMYTSPHLISYTERIQINGQEISQDDFAACIFLVKEKIVAMVAAGEENPTQFEVLTAAAFYYFAKMQVEYAVIEVGLGGLLDSTNVIVPEVSVITNVTYEHADRCGGTLAGIATHKAGIIKEGVPVVTAAEGEALDLIRCIAQEKNADLFVAAEDFQSAFSGFDGAFQQVNFSSELMGLSALYKLKLLGTYQIENSSVAVMTALLLANAEKRITQQNISEALRLVEWNGRFELLQTGNRSIVIDGAHNLAGTTALRKNLDLYFAGKEIVFLLGILKDKDVDGMLQSLIRSEDVVVVTEPDSERLARAEFVAGKVIAKQVEAFPKMKKALQRAIELAGDDKLLCVAGSLYLIGELRKYILEDDF